MYTYINYKVERMCTFYKLVQSVLMLRETLLLKECSFMPDLRIAQHVHNVYLYYIAVIMWIDTYIVCTKITNNNSPFNNFVEIEVDTMS